MPDNPFFRQNWQAEGDMNMSEKTHSKSQARSSRGNCDESMIVALEAREADRAAEDLKTV